MKTLKLIQQPALVVLLFCFTQCGKKLALTFPLGTYLPGRYEWIETVTPSRKIRPSDVGYRETLRIGVYMTSGGKEGYYTIFSRDETPYRYLRQLADNVDEDKREGVVFQTLRDSTGAEYSIKYTIGFKSDKSVDNIRRSLPMRQYSEAADTVQVYYRYVGN